MFWPRFLIFTCRRYNFSIAVEKKAVNIWRYKMLYSIDDQNKPIRAIPHRRVYDTYRSRLSQQEYDAIIKHLNNLVDGDEIHTSSWIPGSDWTGTVFQPIYEKACRKDFEASARFFGLLLWEVMMEHSEDWSFGRYQANDIPIEGMTYFRIRR